MPTSWPADTLLSEDSNDQCQAFSTLYSYDPLPRLPTIVPDLGWVVVTWSCSPLSSLLQASLISATQVPKPHLLALLPTWWRRPYLHPGVDDNMLSQGTFSQDLSPER